QDGNVSNFCGNHAQRSTSKLPILRYNRDSYEITYFRHRYRSCRLAVIHAHPLSPTRNSRSAWISSPGFLADPNPRQFLPLPRCEPLFTCCSHMCFVILFSPSFGTIRWLSLKTQSNAGYRNDESDKCVGIPMDSLITAAARALAAGDPLGALKRVALRDDAPALALRGIAMAQLGDLARAKALLRSAARAFGPKEAV